MNDDNNAFSRSDAVSASFSAAGLPAEQFGEFQAIGQRSLMSLHAENADFVGRRLDGGRRLLQELISVPEATSADVWSVFWENLLIDYAQYAARCAGVGSRFLAELSDQLRREEREIIDDLALQRVV